MGLIGTHNMANLDTVQPEKGAANQDTSNFPGLLRNVSKSMS